MPNLDREPPLQAIFCRSLNPKKSTETEFETTTAGHVRAAFVHYMRQIIRVVNALSDCRVSIEMLAAANLWRKTMQTPVEIDFQGMSARPDIHASIEQHVAALEQRYGRVTVCRVVLKAPGEHHRTGGV